MSMNLRVLALTDCNHAIELGKNLKPRDASLWAQLAICKGVLEQTGHQPALNPTRLRNEVC
jgi:hypothetical protein